MCFSTGASFTASAVLLTIGVVSVKSSTTKPQRFLASIPFVFGIQQFSEGILWLGISHPGFGFLRHAATYIFLSFAQVVWPIILPMAMLMMEPHPRRKKLLSYFLGIGIAVATYLTYCLLFYRISVNADCYHINYLVDYPGIGFKYVGLFYLIPTIIPPIITTIKKLRFLGIITMLAYIITQIFYKEFLISVWCFFAGIISLIVLSVIKEQNRIRIMAAPISV